MDDNQEEWLVDGQWRLMMLEDPCHFGVVNSDITISYNINLQEP